MNAARYSGTLLTIFAIACQGSPSPLDPRTEAAARIAELGWLMMVLGTGTCLITLGGLVIALVAARRRDAPDVAVRSAEESNGALIIGGLVLPSLVIGAVVGYTVITLRATVGSGGPGGAAVLEHGEHGPVQSPVHRAAAASSMALAIAGTQWWWRVSYPDEQLITANEMHVPVGASIRLAVTSEDVIHSFWIPQLLGKVDMLPARTNLVSLRVDQAGVYRGMCAEFCGFQHAHMHLRLFVDRAEEFADWLANERRDAVAPTDPQLVQGQRVFLEAECGGCHTVRGTPATGTRGPDLTHVASRRTLGAGTHENNRANLTGWVIDPQAMKERNKMPATPLAEVDVEPLIAYLESLR